MTFSLISGKESKNLLQSYNFILSFKILKTSFFWNRDDMRPVWLGLEEVVGRGRHRWQEDMSQVTWTKWKKGIKLIIYYGPKGVYYVYSVGFLYNVLTCLVYR